MPPEGAKKLIQAALALQPARDREGDILLVAAGCADRTRVLTAVAGVENHGEQAVDLRVVAARCARRFGGRRLHVDGRLLSKRVVAGIADRGVHRRILADQGQQRIARIRRMQIEHEAVAVASGRGERENLRTDLVLQLDDDADHTWAILRELSSAYLGG